MNWADILTGVIIVAVVVAAWSLAGWNESRLRRKEQAENHRRDREIWELGRPLRERQQLRAERDRLTAFAYNLGATPPQVVQRIAEIDQQLADMRAEQIRKMTEAAQ